VILDSYIFFTNLW